MAAVNFAKLSSALAVLVLLAAVAGIMFNRSNGETSSERAEHDFGEAVQGDTIEHVFSLPNNGDADLVISEVTPLGSTVLRVDSVIPAGGAGQIAIALDTRRMRGRANEAVQVRFTDESRRPVWLRLTGQVVAPIQIAPQDRVYFFTAKGVAPVEEREVINHFDRPLDLLDVTSSNPLFRPSITTVDRGKRYALSVALDSAAPVGRHSGTVTLRTDHPDYSTIVIETRAFVKDIVSTSISRVSFARFLKDALEFQSVSQKTVLVEKYQGTDFAVTGATTDLPFLEVEIEQQDAGKSFLVHVKIIDDRVQLGPFEGTLRIATNDPEFPELTLPISGEVL